MKIEVMIGNNISFEILMNSIKKINTRAGGMAKSADNQLFVSTYMLHLPDKKKLEEFMLKEMEEMGI